MKATNNNCLQSVSVIYLDLNIHYFDVLPGSGITFVWGLWNFLSSSFIAAIKGTAGSLGVSLLSHNMNVLSISGVGSCGLWNGPALSGLGRVLPDLPDIGECSTVPQAPRGCETLAAVAGRCVSDVCGRGVVSNGSSPTGLIT